MRQIYRDSGNHRSLVLTVVGITTAYLVTIGVLFFLQSAFLEGLVQHSFVGPAGWNAAPLLFLAAVLVLWLFLNRSSLPVIARWQRWQIFIGEGGLIATILCAYWATHPSLERFMAMHTFVQSNPITGGPLAAGVLYAALFLPILPALFLLLPWNILRANWRDLAVLLAIFFLSLFGPILDALYHMAVAPLILASVHTLLLPLGGAIAEPDHLRIGFRGFEVIVGPVCSGLNMLALFTAFVGFLWIRTSGLNTARMLLSLTIGLIALFLLNILRITLVMIVGAALPAVGLLLFHSSAGLLLLLLVCLAYWKWGMRYAATYQQK